MTRSPKHGPNHPDRELDCEEALEPFIDMAMAGAEAAGWTQEEAAHALLRLAAANLLGRGHRFDPDKALADLMAASRD